MSKGMIGSIREPSSNDSFRSLVGLDLPVVLAPASVALSPHKTVHAYSMAADKHDTYSQNLLLAIGATILVH
jgi:hypothetical protein